MTYELTLPFPPSNNSLHRNATANNRYSSKKYMSWKKDAGIMALQYKPFPAFKNRVDVECYLSGGASNYDSDNFLKAPMDFIVSLGIIKNDSKKFVRSTLSFWLDDSSQKTIVVKIKEI